MFEINQKRGLVRTILLVIVLILILSYFGIDLQKAVESKLAQKNMNYAKAVVVTIWERYLKAPAEYFWNFFVQLIWKPLIVNLEDRAKAAITPTPVPLE